MFVKFVSFNSLCCKGAKQQQTNKIKDFKLNNNNVFPISLIYFVFIS